LQTSKSILRDQISHSVGKPFKRREDYVLLTGHGSFIDDIKVPNVLHAAILRSAYGHARIKNVDLSEALRTEGVVFAADGRFIKRKVGPLPEVNPPGSSKITSIYMLAVDRVHYTGEPLAVVLAEDRYTAEDALEKINVDYEPLEAIVDAEKSALFDSPRLYDEWDSNESVRSRISSGNVEEALSKSDYIFKETIERHRYTAAPIEPRAYFAIYDPHKGDLMYYAGTQMPHIFRTLLSRSLNISENKIRVVAPNVGGGFGQKAPVYQEEPLIAFLSMFIGRPVKWIETRTENLKAGAHSRQQIHYVEVGVQKDGKITALRDRMIVDFGAYLPLSGLGSVFATASLIPSGYKINNYELDLSVLHTNKAPFGALRGYGKADSNFVMECLLDRISRKIGIDSVELRQRNLIQVHEFPYRSCTGWVYDSGDYRGAVSRACELIHYDKFKSQQESLRRIGIYKGISVSFLLEPSASVVRDSLLNGYEMARITIDPGGKVSVYCGLSSQGQGHETSIAQVVSDNLGLRQEDIVVFEGDTQTISYSLGTWSSRFSIAGIGAIILACEKVKRKLETIASEILETDLSNLESRDGLIIDRTNSRARVSIAEVANVAYSRIHLLPKNIPPGIDETATYMVNPAGYPAWSYGAYGVIVRTDIETGKISIEKQVFVSDVGNIINPLILDGQIVGGIAQGIGGAVFEELVYSENAELLSSTFIDYLIPTSLDIPTNIQVDHMITPSPNTLGGFKGAAEGGCVVPPYGLTNAVVDSLVPFGVTSIKQPLSPENIRTAIRLGLAKK
jgi:carbon-monoxide dehydrogenase large subunit